MGDKMKDLDDLIEIFKYYLDNENNVGELFLDDIWIRSNKYYVFFGEEERMGKTFAMFSKKYLLTIELTKDKMVLESLNRISKVIEIVRESLGYKIEKFQFWLPHCLVNNILVDTKLIAESYGIDRDLALDYLIHYDTVFSKLYNIKMNSYFGLPLFSSYEEAENFKLRDNTKDYLKGLKKLNKILK